MTIVYHKARIRHPQGCRREPKSVQRPTPSPSGTGKPAASGILLSRIQWEQVFRRLLQVAALSGFSALPAGNRNNNGDWNNQGNNANFWSASENSATNARNRNLNYNNADLNANNNNKNNGFSLRCTKDW